jgi:hypothetical protein
MSSLFDAACRDRFLARIDALRPDSPRAWGKMDAAQAMTHCAIALEAATGDTVLPRSLPAKLIGPLFRGWLLSPKPYSKNSPTHPLLVITTPQDFAREKDRLVRSVRRFHELGPASAAKFQHALIGRVTGDEWDRLQHKHLDHHLRQFGV